jgi:hypothetical protein
VRGAGADEHDRSVPNHGGCILASIEAMMSQLCVKACGEVLMMSRWSGGVLEADTLKMAAERFEEFKGHFRASVMQSVLLLCASGCGYGTIDV